jgi:trimethylamine---corrinoid protein Co-methyltransferase
MGTSLPFFRPLTPGDTHRIDQASRRLLAEVGLHINRSVFLKRLKAEGADVDFSEERVRFSPECLDALLSRAPTHFWLCSRDGKNDLHMGRERGHFCNGGRVFRILDIGTGGYRPTLLRDVADTATLVDRLPHIRLYIVACQAHDVPPAHYHLNDYFQALNHTTKHVMGGCTDLAGARQLYALASLVAGSEETLRKRPFVSVITNLISPLTLDANTLHILDFCGKKGIPAVCATAPIAGATAPVTLAGTLVQMHAEALGAVAVMQALSPGAKILYGAFPTAMDMRTMELTMGSVEMGMMNAAAVRLAKLYRLPVYASGGVTEAKRPDIQAGFEKNFSNLTVAMAKADLIHLTAGMIDSCNSICLEQFVIDNENIGMIGRILRGIRVNDDTLAMDVIRRVGPRGQYTTEEHTLDHLGDEYYYPELSVRCNYDVWLAEGRPDVVSRAHGKVKEILDDGREGLLDTNTIFMVEKAFPGLQTP